MIDFDHLNALELQKIGIEFTVQTDAEAFVQLLIYTLEVRTAAALRNGDETLPVSERTILAARGERERLEAELLEFRTDIPGTLAFGKKNPYARDIKCLNLSVRSYNVLYRAGLRTVARVAACRDLNKLRHIGKFGAAEIQSKMEQYLAQV